MFATKVKVKRGGGKVYIPIKAIREELEFGGTFQGSWVA